MRHRGTCLFVFETKVYSSRVEKVIGRGGVGVEGGGRACIREAQGGGVRVGWWVGSCACHHTSTVARSSALWQRGVCLCTLDQVAPGEVVDEVASKTAKAHLSALQLRKKSFTVKRTTTSTADGR